MVGERVNSIIEESKQELVRFIISIALSFIGIAILAMLILFIPSSAMSFGSINGGLPLIYSTFFYSWSFSLFGPHSGEYHYELESFLPSTGYFIFSSIAILLLLIGNSGLLLRDKKKTKKLIFISWGFIIITVIAYITKLVLMRPPEFISIPIEVIAISSNLCFYPLFYLPLQFVLLFDKKASTQFFGLEKRNQVLEVKEVIMRRINAILTLIVYLSTIFLFLKSLFYQNYIDYVVNKFVIAILSAIYLIWFLTNLGIYLIEYRNHKSMSFIGFLAGIGIITIIVMLIDAIEIEILFDMMGTAYYSIDFPKTPLVILFITALILISSIPIGYFGRNLKETAIFASIVAITNFVFHLLIGISILSPTFQTGAKVLAFFLVPFYALMVYAGTFWGRFLAKKIYNEEVELEENSIERIL